MKNRSHNVRPPFRGGQAALGAVLLSGAIIVAILSWTAGPLAGTPASAAPGPGGGGPGGGGAPPHANPVFARNVTGTWAATLGNDQLLMNIRSDGTLDWVGSWFFGGGSGDFIDGAVFGSWEQTGPYELTSIELGQLFEGDGTFWGTGRVKQVMTFNAHFQSFEVVGSEDLFLAGQDPTDPLEVPFQSFNFGYGPANRLNHGLMD